MLYHDYCIHRGVRGHDATWVAPFGYPGIIACWQLPQAFRSLLRPSSPVVPRYPPVCSYVLTKTRSIRNTIFEIAVHALRMDPPSCLAHESSSLCSFQCTRTLRTAGCAGDLRALKAEQCSPDEARAMREHRLAGDPRSEGRATDAENIGLVVLIRTLAEMAGRTPNFEHRLWST